MNLARLIRSANPLAFSNARQRQLDFIRTYDFSPGLRAKFAKTHDLLDTNQQELVFFALRDYFTFCHQAKQTMVSMPSQVVDDAWHEFILFTKEYNDFCAQAFGRYLHHTPAEAMEAPTTAQFGIQRAWKMACKKEGIHPGAPSTLPLIFGIDAMLSIPNGFFYTLNCLSGDHSNRHQYCATHIGGCAGALGCGGGSGDSGSSHGGAHGHGDCGHGGDGHGGSDGGGGDGGGGHGCGGHGCGGSGCGGGGCGGGGGGCGGS